VPAYRSSAEAEVREAVVARLRQIRPEARIMHEVNASSFGNRIDVLAVSRAEIIAVEIKSERDKLDRLKDQVAAMRGCAQHVIAAVHNKFGLTAVKEATQWHATHWFFPADNKDWTEPRPAISTPLPHGALDMLWREELLEMCGRFGVCVPKRPTMGAMLPALRWTLSGRDLTLGICAALRARQCVEADPAIELPALAA
jgi:hypothetical protein